MFSCGRYIASYIMFLILLFNTFIKKLLCPIWRLFHTPRTASRRGFSLASELLSFVITLMVVEVLLILLHSFKQIPKQEIALDIPYAIKEITTLVNTATTVEVYDTYIELDHERTLSLNKNRLVVQPGFNILLHHIDRCYFEVKDQQLWIHLYKNKMKGRYYVGVLYRPEKRVEPLPDPSESSDDV